MFMLSRVCSFLSCLPCPPLVAALLVVPLACGPKNQPPPQPPVTQPEPEPEPEKPPEPEPEPPKVPEGSVAVGAFNLDWAFDALGDRRPKAAKDHVAPDDDTWEWKRDHIVEVLIAEKLDIVVLSELGGERELGDIVSSVSVKGGYDYQYAWVASKEHGTGQQVAILSRFPITGERRYEANLPKHVAAEVELPSGDEVTVIGVHMKEGKFKGQVNNRRKQATSIQRHANREKKKRPVIIMGTVGSATLPFDEDYKGSAPGILSGKNTSRSSDDCMDSGVESLAQQTTVDGDPADRIFVCGLEMKNPEVSGRDKIVREADDPGKTPWVKTPVDKEPHRDVSDHLIIWAEVVMPKKPAPEGEGGENEGDKADKADKAEGGAG